MREDQDWSTRWIIISSIVNKYKRSAVYGKPYVRCNGRVEPLARLTLPYLFLNLCLTHMNEFSDFIASDFTVFSLVQMPQFKTAVADAVEPGDFTMEVFHHAFDHREYVYVHG